MSGGLYNLNRQKGDTTLDLKAVKPYGDTMNDGKVQVSFTLPVKNGDEAVEAAKELILKMGLMDPNITIAKPLADNFTFFVAYGSCVHTVNYEDIHVITVYPYYRICAERLFAVGRLFQFVGERYLYFNGGLCFGDCFLNTAHDLPQCYIEILQICVFRYFCLYLCLYFLGGVGFGDGEFYFVGARLFLELGDAGFGIIIE